MPESPDFLTFDMPTDDFPLVERIALRGSIAFFESQIAMGTDVSADTDFLGKLPRIFIAYGACDCFLYPFICIPEIRFRELPLASTILRELRVSNFKSEHIKNLDAVYIPYPGYKPGTENDEIHTESQHQAIFTKPEDFVAEENQREITGLSSIRWHSELQKYVLDGHLYYILLHSKPHTHRVPSGIDSPDFEVELSEWVILFAIGVSPRTGNLVGAITSQCCHNYCD